MKSERLVTPIFLATEVLIYLTFIITDLAGQAPGLSGPVKYTGIILVFAHALILSVGARRKESFLITAALFFTAVADVFLLFFSSDMRLLIVGLVSFSITQTLYGILTSQKKSTAKRILTPVVTAAVAAVISAIIGNLLHYDIVTGFFVFLVFYYANTFGINTARSWSTFKRSRLRTDLVFALGLTLFVLCDINVVIRNLNTFYYELIPGSTVNAAAILSWIFYLPSQVMISICCKTPNTRRTPDAG